MRAPAAGAAFACSTIGAALVAAAGALAEGFAAMGTDSLLAGRPIHQPIVKTAQIDAAFDSIT